MPDSVAMEAEGLVNGSRQSDYGTPYDNWTQIAKGWSIIFGTELTAEQCAMAMIWLKISRNTHKPTRDNLTDICGYALVVEHIRNHDEEKA